MEKVDYEYFAKQILEAALEVHRSLGPGLLEAVYEFALVKELDLREVSAERQIKVPLHYKEFDTGKVFYLDILVEDEIIIEVKSCEDGIKPVHQAQLLSYLKLADKKLGFVINFNVPLLKSGLKRMVNDYFQD